MQGVGRDLVISSGGAADMRRNTGPLRAGIGMMNQRSVSERQFRRHVAQVRARFVALWVRDPEQALEDLLEDLSELMRDAVRLDAAYGFGITGQLITKAPARTGSRPRRARRSVASQA